MKNRMQDVIKLASDLGLDPFPVIYETIARTTMDNICAYGLPTRARHWSYGRSYDHQKTYGEMGYSKVYEVILNNNPSYAFLLDTNSEVQNLFVAAHCEGHSHFFKHNCMFQGTDRNMVSHAAERAGRVEEYIERYGLDKVERIMDIGFALDSHIDPHKGVYRRPYESCRVETHVPKYNEFDDMLNPDKSFKPIKTVVNKKIPPRPEKDLLWFFINYAPLEDWEKDVLDIIRQEAYYFYPQRITKIANEGWACVVPDSHMFVPDRGMVLAKDIVDKKLGQVYDKNNNVQKVTDFYSSKKRCKTIITKKGFSLGAALQHRVVVLENGKEIWKEFKNLKENDLVKIQFNQQCFGKELVCVNGEFKPKKCGVFKSGFKFDGKIDKNVARFFGYYVSEGNLSCRAITITNGDLNVVNDVVKLGKQCFNLDATVKKDENRYRIHFYSQQLINLFEDLNLLFKAKEKRIPDVVLKSPKEVVESFLTGLFTGDGGCYHNNKLLVASTSSVKMASQLQNILLNFGVISTKQTLKKEGYADNYHIAVTNPVDIKKLPFLMDTPCENKKYNLVKYFQYDKDFSHHDRIFLSDEEILCLQKSLNCFKQRELKKEGINPFYFGKHGVISRSQIQKMINMDIKIESSILEKFQDQNCFYDVVSKISNIYESPVVDFTVDDTHSYVCEGFVNHNSYWHAEIMYQYNGMSSSEYLDFVRNHEKVVQPGGNPFKINPYYLGFKIFKDIERRWDKDFGKGAGKDQILKVCREEDDISFLRNYLTKDLIEDMNLFAYGYDKKYPATYKGSKYIRITSKMVDDIVENMISPLYNNGVPKIVISEIGKDGKLILKHDSENMGTIDRKYAAKTLEYIWELWAAPVELRVLNEEKNELILHFDEGGFQIEREDDEEEEKLQSDLLFV